LPIAERRLPPGRIAFEPRARAVLELPITGGEGAD
jgi:hypothetical protein